ncbi:UDP-N-acetylmuramoyl-L-alanyl-D-glutamate--2,6-diaminopimelate ligase [Gilvibacter sediminis]|uniref:UDP-N-acetylmuramoyl-L-alanyl-D-glutamate--2, 6-diaminopimelate ligase n=1 Tax=Gilvibacter sediminis TaxID=379071 RepID=UPI00235072A2|nr:UDP-N-acetylmuramoyl-L-alanyl-D-glutamate--2,6-diaminopimelate ligase [Gilvibacter sediminis]MDC7998649.1 UDP-N-acetylmuramoyl-L-alanyl-D-glutamate--2,6-diaminopimelate ligase [Gilvibacter sediminis]
MIKLKDLLYKVSLDSVVGGTDVAVNTVAYDSRKIGLNDVFVAIRGTQVDGHDYIKKATHAGAIAIVCEEVPAEIINGVTYAVVTDANSALAQIAANYYQDPSQELQLVGVTGTNGKTTIASLLYDLYLKAGYTVGLLSTVVVKVGQQEFPATHTTPDPLAINGYLRQMVDAGVDYCFMEVSSHGIHQKRTEGLQFKGGIFTNLTHDHLDYHNSFKEYRDVKKAFFDQLPKDAFALTNLDDKNGRYMLQNTKAKKYTYALKSIADYKAQLLEHQFSGMLLKINNSEIWVKLIGEFNAYNLLAIHATADLLGMDAMENLQFLSELESVSGRFQYFTNAEQVTAIVDYAHTPDALKNVLETINAIRTGNEQLITVVGCGGDRDPDKRPKMGMIAAAMSTTAIFTSDNPRSEDPDTIIEAMEEGVEPQHFKRTLSITDRKQAIKTACKMANANDIILVAGKGHEAYQEIKGERFDFDDYQIIHQLLTI